MGCVKVDRRRASTRSLVVARPRPVRAGKTILLVEDEDFVRKVTSEVLVACGFRVLAVSNAQEALDAFQEHQEQVQLVLTDVVMPGNNGRKLAQDLRDVAPGLGIILTSGYPDRETPDGGFSQGLHYLPKPYSVESLITKVREVLADK